MTPDERAAKCINDNLAFFTRMTVAEGDDLMAQSLKLAHILRDLVRDARAVALEEAAKACLSTWQDLPLEAGDGAPTPEDCAKKIRALLRNPVNPIK